MKKLLHSGCECGACSHPHHFENKVEKPDAKKEKLNLIIVGVRLLLAIGLLIPTYFIADELIILILSLCAYLIIGYSVLYNAIKRIFKGKFFDENFLMSIATIGALFIQEYQEAILVMIFYCIGELLEDFATSKSNKSIENLINDIPLVAHINKDGVTSDIDPLLLAIDDIIEVRAGEKIPVDGILLSGISTLDYSSITGESLPIESKVNQEIISGVINISGVITIRVTKEFKNSTLSKIMEIVRGESEKKSNSENFITRFSKIYTPSVIVLALGLFVTLFALNSWQEYQEPLYRSLTFLVIACPCALVISVPLSFFGAIGKGSKLGFLIKGSLAVENMAKIKHVAFDKTGTITKGKFEIVSYSDEETLKIAGAIESKSNHPIATSITSLAQSDASIYKLGEITNLEGLGIKAFVNEKEYYFGGETILRHLNIEVPPHSDTVKPLYLVSSGLIIGTILIADVVKETSSAAIAALYDVGFVSTTVLSGDSSSTTRKIAEEVGISDAFGELLPTQKKNFIKKLHKKQRGAYVGDGINDSPSLLAANVGISMGGIGSDLAIESSDVVVMDDDLLKVAKLKRLSKFTMKIIYENIGLILFVKIGFIVLSGFGLVTMLLSLFADVGILLIAVINSLRIIYRKKY